MIYRRMFGIPTWGVRNPFHELGRMRQQMDDFFSKKITYAEWARHDINMWKEKGVTRDGLKKAIAPLRLMPGALETIQELKKKGMRLAVISGSLDIALEHVLPNLNF